jgi:hypothetical protein
VRYSALWGEPSDDDFFLQGLGRWLRTGAARHPSARLHWLDVTRAPAGAEPPAGEIMRPGQPIPTSTRSTSAPAPTACIDLPVFSDVHRRQNAHSTMLTALQMTAGLKTLGANRCRIFFYGIHFASGKFAKTC